MDARLAALVQAINIMEQQLVVIKQTVIGMDQHEGRFGGEPQIKMPKIPPEIDAALGKEPHGAD